MTDYLVASPAANRAAVPLARWLRLAEGLALVLLMTSCGQMVSLSSDPTNQKGIGEKLVGWQLQPLTGDSRALSPLETQGRVVLLNFWGTWCPPCRQEFPHIAELAHHFSTEPDFILAAVSCGGGGDDSQLEPLREETAQFLDRVKSDLPTYADQDGVTRKELASVTGFDGYPTTVVLDGEGAIRGVWVGYEPGTEKQMERLVDELLHKRSAAKH